MEQHKKFIIFFCVLAILGSIVIGIVIGLRNKDGVAPTNESLYDPVQATTLPLRAYVEARAESVRRVQERELQKRFMNTQRSSQPSPQSMQKPSQETSALCASLDESLCVRNRSCFALYQGGEAGYAFQSCAPQEYNTLLCKRVANSREKMFCL